MSGVYNKSSVQPNTFIMIQLSTYNLKVNKYMLEGVHLKKDKTHNKEASSSKVFFFLSMSALKKVDLNMEIYFLCADCFVHPIFGFWSP